jgi:hypothetical protein
MTTNPNEEGTDMTRHRDHQRAASAIRGELNAQVHMRREIDAAIVEENLRVDFAIPFDVSVTVDAVGATSPLRADVIVDGIEFRYRHGCRRPMFWPETIWYSELQAKRDQDSSGSQQRTLYTPEQLAAWLEGIAGDHDHPHRALSEATEQ